MSTRSGGISHRDKETGVSVHIYEELVDIDTPKGWRIEITHPCGVSNLPWPAALLPLPEEWNHK
jgi:hypothetical protein